MRKAIVDRLAEGKGRLSQAFARTVDAIYPPQCLACPKPTETPQGLCGTCWRETFFFSGKVCDYCGVTVPTAEGHDGRVICDSCSHAPPAWDRGRAAVAYEGVGRRLALSLKHGDRLDTVAPLARWMRHAGEAFLGDDVILVPVPLHWRRLLERTYNQSAELARAIHRQTNTQFVPEMLRRVRNTPRQFGPRQGRFATVSEAFTPHPRHVSDVDGRRVLLVDDVLTSGATLSACADILKASGAQEVNVLVLARVTRDT